LKVIGITGSSGSGKTTLTQILNKKKEISVIDADKVVKEMSVPNTDYLNAIKETFGLEMFLEDGNLNRKLLGNRIYSEKESLEKLNKLTFKYVVEEILKRIESTTQENKNIKYLIIDAPLLFESGLNRYCDYVIALIANRNLKIKRICKRDNIDEKTAQSRLNIQKEDSYYIKKADFVIENNENCNLEKEIESILSNWGR